VLNNNRAGFFRRWLIDTYTAARLAKVVPMVYADRTLTITDCMLTEC
jgi:hypothetical protein